MCYNCKWKRKIGNFFKNKKFPIFLFYLLRVGEEKVAILLFADDMVLIAESEAELRELMRAVEEYCKEWHLEVNVDKTKVMVTSKDGEQSAKVVYGQRDKSV